MCVWYGGRWREIQFEQALQVRAGTFKQESRGQQRVPFEFLVSLTKQFTTDSEGSLRVISLRIEIKDTS